MEQILIRHMPIGRFGRIVPGQGKGAGKIGFRTASCFFLIDAPDIDWLATSPLVVEMFPEEGFKFGRVGKENDFL